MDPVQRALREGLVINLHGDAILLSKGGENPLQLDSQTIPVIASFNGSTASGWTSFAKQIQQAGADALELNLYNIPTDQHSHRQFGAWDLELFNPPLLA